MTKIDELSREEVVELARRGGDGLDLEDKMRLSARMQEFILVDIRKVVGELQGVDGGRAAPAIRRQRFEVLKGGDDA